jgi:hypothetical protein
MGKFHGNMSLPAGGGDPWWKVMLQFAGGRRRCPNETPTGYFEPIADYFEPGRTDTAIEKPDYFVVLRTNSGRKDLSGRTSGPGAAFGGDFRAFIERVDGIREMVDTGMVVFGFLI